VSSPRFDPTTKIFRTFNNTAEEEEKDIADTKSTALELLFTATF